MLLFSFFLNIFCQGYELSGEIALKNNHYYYYYYYIIINPMLLADKHSRSQFFLGLSPPYLCDLPEMVTIAWSFDWDVGDDNFAKSI